MRVRPKRPAGENALLAALPSIVRERLTPSLKEVQLVAGRTLYDLGSAVDYVWFITSGIVSLLILSEDGKSIEVAAVGPEGVIGLSGITKENGVAIQAKIQISGRALRIDIQTFRTVLQQECALSELLFEYTHTLSAQIAQAVICNRFHSTEQRLVRWLLMADDRASFNPSVLTHSNLAQLLGVSRSRISMIVGSLQKQGLIGCLRGRINTLNRTELEAYVCECYSSITQAIGWYLPT